MHVTRVKREFREIITSEEVRGEPVKLEGMLGNLARPFPSG